MLVHVFQNSHVQWHLLTCTSVNDMATAMCTHFFFLLRCEEIEIGYAIPGDDTCHLLGMIQCIDETYARTAAMTNQIYRKSCEFRLCSYMLQYQGQIGKLPAVGIHCELFKFRELLQIFADTVVREIKGQHMMCLA
ncbi:hypothetical protein D3C76_1307030 [compost metagenome]